MTKYLLKKLVLGCMILGCLDAHAQPDEFHFGVVGRPVKVNNGISSFNQALAKINEDSLAFVVVNGLKSRNEPCSDSLYNSRKKILSKAENGIIISLTASDWADCKNAKGKSAAVERLNRLRDLFFSEKTSFGAQKISLKPQSTNAKFRSYSENSQWEIGMVLFATLNVPANNNHYRPEAGRNSEFEDRQIANRDWLQRVFITAKRKKSEGIVLFLDGDPFATEHTTKDTRDGFAEVRQQITSLSANFSGKVLLIHGNTDIKSTSENSIIWRDNLGTLYIDESPLELTVTPSTSTLFSIFGKVDESNVDSKTN